MFSIDGITWNVKCKIERTSKITASEISGLMLDRSYFNDITGTYMQYEISIAVPFGREEDYDEIYEQLTKPVDGHVFQLPYNQGTITVTGRVESVSDVMYYRQNNKKYWAETRFTVIANHPSKYEDLGTVIARGRAPLPEASEVEQGATYTYEGSGWVPVTDADEVYW